MCTVPLDSCTIVTSQILEECHLRGRHTQNYWNLWKIISLDWIIQICPNFCCLVSKIILHSPNLHKVPGETCPLTHITCTWIVQTIGAFIHKKDRDFHRDWNTEIFLRLPSGMNPVHRTAHAWYQALPLFWYARLEWWDRKYQDYLLERSHIRRDANICGYSQIIALIPK